MGPQFVKLTDLRSFELAPGVTGQPLFYPRSFRDMEYGLEAFARAYDCAGAEPGERAHISFPLGIHPVGQVFARCAASRGITVNWAGSGTSTPSSRTLYRPPNTLRARLKSGLHPPRK